MKYVKPKIEFNKIEYIDNIADLSSVVAGTGGSISWGDLFKITSASTPSNVNYY